MPTMARPSLRPSRRRAQPTRQLRLDLARACTSCLMRKAHRRCIDFCIAAVVFLTRRARVLLCGHVQVAVTASASQGNRRSLAASSACQHPSVAWPDATSDCKALERAEMLHSEAASALTRRCVRAPLALEM
jgi:hypothetical protein